ncbi:hypothetical protein Amsp01_065550 [Amycolatopsis sp. NBRC 101858]|jgi:hypothetical protein|uniref:DUF6529 family protein n=1 Tax=Amycolatopsis sp. NBRC 101858 TaxID=3032200 RepID=UPI0024A5CBA0|nr:DUF6529 family protein [Amycolatopsis sp. NBRC 101858]GLY40532.1 hypothetical protein Amsp01_065550 [Amycolatopsis sp. NBRC 101858]
MTTAGNRAGVALLVPLVAGAVVSVVLGVYGSLHTPTGVAVNVAGFSSPMSVKAWLATVVVVLAIVQLLSALAMYGKLGRTVPAWVSPVHRWSGRLAFLVSIPVALHCLYALGFQSFDTRVLLHSLLGCFFYGAFVAKMLLLRKDGAPGWALPVFGGLVFTGLVGLWLSASLWFFTQSGLTF